MGLGSKKLRTALMTNVKILRHKALADPPMFMAEKHKINSSSFAKASGDSPPKLLAKADKIPMSNIKIKGFGIWYLSFVLILNFVLCYLDLTWIF